ncbi:MAG: hypothetical protein HGA53_02850, partial [Anaerolineaceae bacterium]|nr:hypothetical protein [Anaerolineaceae bacterium]
MNRIKLWINASIRNKMVLLIASVAILLFIVLMTAARNVLFGQIYVQEQTGIEKSLRTIQASVQNEIQRLNSVCQDWSIWDETYNFLAGQNVEYYHQNNLTDLTLVNLQVDYLIFFDRQGKLYNWRGFDYFNEQRLDLPEGFESYLASNPIMENDVANQ